MSGSQQLVRILASVREISHSAKEVLCFKTQCKALAGKLDTIEKIIEIIEDKLVSNDTGLGSSFLEIELILEKINGFLHPLNRRPGKLFQIAAVTFVASQLRALTAELALCVENLHNKIDSSALSFSEKIDNLLSTYQSYDFSLQPRILNAVLTMESLVHAEGTEGSSHSMKLSQFAASLLLTTDESLLKERSLLLKELIRTDSEASNIEKKCAESAVTLLNAICKNKVNQKYKQIIPEDYVCLLLLKIMNDPVILSSGNAFEKGSVEKWFSEGNITCPKTGAMLENLSSIPDVARKAIITEWCSANGIQRILEPNKEVSTSNNVQQSLESERSLEGTINFHSSGESINNGDEKLKSLLERRGNWEGASRLTGLNTIIQGSERSVVKYKPKESPSSILPENSQEDWLLNLGQSRQAFSHVRGLSEPSGVRSPSTPIIQGIDELSPVTGCTDESKLYLEANEPDISLKPLIEQLYKDSLEEKKKAVAKLRKLAKDSMAYRLRIAEEGGIPAIVELISSTTMELVEEAVTALLNISLSDGNKSTIISAGALRPLILVLEKGSSTVQENAATTLFSLSLMDEYKVEIASRGAIPPLVNLLMTGTERGLKDSCSALLSLSLFIPNRRLMVQAGIVQPLLRNLNSVLSNKASALLANVSSVPEGTCEIIAYGGLKVLVELLDFGTSKVRENIVVTLSHIAANDGDILHEMAREGALPPLVALSQGGSSRIRQKADILVKQLRERRRKSCG